MQTETHDQTLPPDSPALLRQTDQILARIHILLGDQGIRPNEVQQQMLASHIKAMVWRSHSGEPLPEVDLSLFEEISPPLAASRRARGGLPPPSARYNPACSRTTCW